MQGIDESASQDSAASRVLDGLVPATIYVVQVRAHGRVGASDWSESVTLVAS